MICVKKVDDASREMIGTFQSWFCIAITKKYCIVIKWIKDDYSQEMIIVLIICKVSLILKYNKTQMSFV